LFPLALQVFVPLQLAEAAAAEEIIKILQAQL
jgi:hypothetical protein